MFVPSKSKSVLGCLTTEPVSSDAVNRNRKLEDTHHRLLNLQGVLVRGCLWSQLKPKMKFITLVSRLWL